MKKMIIKAVTALLIFGGFKVVVFEPNKPHTFKVTIPAFTDIVEFFDKIAEATEEVTKDFEVTPVDDNEDVSETNQT